MIAPRACAFVTACLALAAGPLPGKPVSSGGPRVWKGHAGQVTALQFSADGKLVASAGIDGKILIREAVNGKATVSPAGHAGGVYSISFAPNGKTLVSAGADGMVRAWDTTTGKEVRSSLGHKGKVAAVAFSRDGKQLASGGYDGSIILWNPATGKQVRRLSEHKGRVTCIAFSPDGKRLISGGTIRSGQSFGKGILIETGVADILLEWDLAKGTAQRLSGRGSSLAATADGKTVAAGGMLLDIQRSGKGTSLDGLTAIFLIEERTGKALHQIKWRGQAVTFSPDGKTLASGCGSALHLAGFGVLGPNGVNARNTDQRIHLWEAASGKQLLRLPQKDATVLAFSPDGKTLAAGNFAGDLTFWDLESEKRHPTPDPAEQVAPPPPGDKLLAGLHADFVALLKKEKNPAALRQANKLLNQTNRSDRWTYYFDALAILRKQRSRAGIPLLLRYMVEHTDQGDFAAYANTLAILTGEERFDFHAGRAGSSANKREHVQKLVETWWQPNKDWITTDFDRMTSAQIQIVLGRLLNLAKRDMRQREEEDPARKVDSILSSLEDRRDRQSWHDEDLHASMLPLLLAEAHYQEKPPKKAARENFAIPYDAIPLLAVLRKRGEAPSLDRIATDRLQSSATRLTCLLALYAAGVSLRGDSVLPLLGAEKKLERRLVAIRLLGLCRDEKAVRPHLIELLEDPNGHVRTATLAAFTTVGPAGALQKLKRLLDDPDPREATDAILGLIGQVGTPEAKQTLADALAKALEGGKRGNRDLSSALYAFEAATGKQWIEAGAHSERNYREAAQKALKWWQGQKPRSSLEADWGEWIKGEKNSRELREAVLLLERSRDDRWAYRDALRLLRRGRSKAAVPLLLTYLIKHNTPNTSWQLREYADVITILTGKEVPDSLLADPKAVEKKVRAWWDANKEAVTTDPEKMSGAEVRRVVRKLLEVGRSGSERRIHERISTSEHRWVLDEALASFRHERPTWWKEELHPVMVPALITAGNEGAPGDAKGHDRPSKGRKAFPYAAIGMLAALHADGDAPELGRTARDGGQSPAARLLCLLALFRAGERLTPPPLLSLLENEKDLGCRLVATLALGYCQDGKACGLKLVELLDDPNAEIRNAAVIALEARPTRKALAKLKTMLDKNEPGEVVQDALSAVAAIRNRAARETLARFLEKVVASPNNKVDVYFALRAFEEATGANWIEAGAHDDNYYRSKGRLALAWWKKQKE